MNTLIPKLEANLTAVFSQFASCPGVDFRCTKDCIRFTSGCDVNWMNGVLWANFSADELPEKASQIIDEFRTQKISAIWKLGQETGHRVDLINYLRGAGLKKISEDPMMVLDVAEMQIPQSPLQVTQVRTDSQIEDWLVPYANSFGLSLKDVDFYRQYLDKTAIHPEHPFQHFVGYYRGQPVSCASTFCTHDTSAIYNVATNEAMRGQGFGTYMTSFAAAQLRERGERHVGLIASEMGLRLYERIGFVKVGAITEFEM